jgi:hypothetical protein
VSARDRREDVVGCRTGLVGVRPARLRTTLKLVASGRRGNPVSMARPPVASCPPAS